MLHLVSFAHRMLHAEASLHPALQTGAPNVKRCSRTLPLASRAEAARRSAARGTAIQDGGSGPCAERLRPALWSAAASSSAAQDCKARMPTPPPLMRPPTKLIPIKQPHLRASWQGERGLDSGSWQLCLLQSRNQAFLCFGTKLQLVALVRAPPGRRTPVAGQLERVSNNLCVFRCM